jgi:cysteinyl-tRNA synthetase
LRILEQAIDRGYEEFTLAMDDDFNTAQAIAVLFDLARETNSLLNQAGQLSEGELGYILHKVEGAFVELGGVIGLFGNKANDDTNLELIENIMQIVIDIRQEARQKKDWATADVIRNRLQEIGIILEDTPQGPRWKKR